VARLPGSFAAVFRVRILRHLLSPFASEAALAAFPGMRPKPGQPTLDRTSGKAEGSRFGNPQFHVVKAAFLLAKGGDGISNPDPKGRMAPADGWAEKERAA
jgi:hypothetical protein